VVSSPNMCSSALHADASEPARRVETNAVELLQRQGITEAKMRGTQQVTKPITMPYATGADFCRIFNQEIDSLYLLSFLLTADHETAEKCFVRGLDDSIEGNPVFKEWARSWARRTIIQSAIGVIGPRPMDSSSTSNSAAGHSRGRRRAEQLEIAAILALAPFDRFAFVLSVLERYSDQESAVLLGCTRRDVATARSRTLQQIADSVEFLRRQLAHTGAEERGVREDFGSLAPSEGTRLIATSA